MILHGFFNKDLYLQRFTSILPKSIRHYHINVTTTNIGADLGPCQTFSQK